MSTIGPLQPCSLFDAIVNSVAVDVSTFGSNALKFWYFDEQKQDAYQWTFSIVNLTDEQIIDKVTKKFEPMYCGGVRFCNGNCCIALNQNKSNPSADYDRAMQVIGKR